MRALGLSTGAGITNRTTTMILIGTDFNVVPFLAVLLLFVASFPPLHSGATMIAVDKFQPQLRDQESGSWAIMEKAFALRDQRNPAESVSK